MSYQSKYTANKDKFSKMLKKNFMKQKFFLRVSARVRAVVRVLALEHVQTTGYMDMQLVVHRQP